MSTQPIDYAALAKQAGAVSSTPPPAAGKIDYAKLAKESGAIGYEPPLQLITDTAQSVPLDAVKQYASDAVDALKTGAKEIAKGAVKSALQPAAKIAQGINKIPIIGEKIVPKVGVEAFRKATTQENIPQEIGGGLEQAAEMALGGGLAKQALARLPWLAGRYIAPAARVAAETANVAGDAAAHGQPVGPAAAIGGAGAAASEAAPFVAPWLKKQAVETYSKALSPSKEATKYETRKLVPELINRGELGSTGGMLKRSEAKTDALGKQIDTAVSAVPNSVKPDPQSIVKHLEDYKQGFIVNGVPVDTDAVHKATELQGIIGALGPDVSYQSLNKVRQIWDAKVSKAGGYVGKTLTEGSMIDAQREGANAIRSELAKQSPDIAKINAEFHFWRGVEDVLGQTQLRRTGQEGGLIRNTLPWLGAATGLSHGGLTQHGLGESALISATMYAIGKATQSPAWRTTSGVLKGKLAQAMASGAYGEAQKIATRITAGVVGQNSASAKPAPPPVQAQSSQ